MRLVNARFPLRPREKVSLIPHCSLHTQQSNKAEKRNDQPSDPKPPPRKIALAASIASSRDPEVSQLPAPLSIEIALKRSAQSPIPANLTLRTT